MIVSAFPSAGPSMNRPPSSQALGDADLFFSKGAIANDIQRHFTTFLGTWCLSCEFLWHEIASKDVQHGPWSVNFEASSKRWMLQWPTSSPSKVGWMARTHLLEVKKNRWEDKTQGNSICFVGDTHLKIYINIVIYNDLFLHLKKHKPVVYLLRHIANLKGPSYKDDASFGDHLSVDEVQVHARSGQLKRQLNGRSCLSRHRGMLRTTLLETQLLGCGRHLPQGVGNPKEIGICLSCKYSSVFYDVLY